MSLETTVAGIKLEHPVMNAAGTVKTKEGVAQMARSASAAVMLGSITYEARGGNTGDTYWASSTHSLNSL